jgi:hypothetical protein
MSRRWIRLDTTWSQSEWLADLEPEHKLVWVELLCYAKAHGTDGRVKASNAALRHVTGVTRYAVDKLVTAAIEHGALEMEDGLWVITGWKAYQGDATGATRQKRYREAQQQVTEISAKDTVTGVTRYGRDVTPTETETETINKRVRKSPIYTEGFLKVWKIHPKGPKPKAMEAYARALDLTTHDTIVDSLRSYVEKFTSTWTGSHLHRWLEGERWEEGARESPADLAERMDYQRRLMSDG